MNQSQVLVEVHCLSPSWILYEDNRYRIYINDELLTERTWIWKCETFIAENIWVSLEPEIWNSIKLEIVRFPTNSVCTFGLKNLTVNGKQWPSEQADQLELSFHL